MKILLLLLISMNVFAQSDKDWRCYTQNATNVQKTEIHIHQFKVLINRAMYHPELFQNQEEQIKNIQEINKIMNEVINKEIATNTLKDFECKKGSN